ncbi:type IV pilus modification PilV family protein [Solibacillus sp. NPDC093137]|uniref:type IV pilus modification PilV family protein n=1 Tax=Solibacillus sp. NPDC093137 TaxID=3390678 RepID=UPI003D0291CA
MKTNEKGFSLVIALFVIVIFTTIGLSLITLNFTNTKQINLTKEQQVATDLAEIGIIYYETLYTEHSFNVLNDAIKNTIKHIETLNKSKNPDAQIPINVNTIITHLILDRSNFIDKNIKINVNILDTPNDNFKITYQNLLTNSPNEIKVTFISKGFTGNGKTAELTGHITLSIQQYIDDYLKGNPTSSAVKLKEIPKIEAIEKLKNINNQCNSNNLNSLNNCKITQNVNTDNQSTYNGVVGVIEGTLEINNNNTVKDSIVYVKNNMTFNQSFDLTNSTFYSEGTGDFGNAGLNNTTLYIKNGGNFGNVDSGIVDSKVYSDGEFTFGNINSNHVIKNSEFIINGKFKMGNFNTLVQKSQFYVNGNVELQHFNTAGFKDSLIISNGNFVMDTLNSIIENSKIIVTGNFKSGNFNQHIDDTSVICAGSFSGGIIQYKNNNLTKKIYDSTSNPELFKEGGICSLSDTVSEENTPDPTSLLNHLDVLYN